ncbi:MAG: 1-(5-phosphoribosyl)-5-[(5-phosphoribosylamino)methylideneamino] imidazole-4-carboxamide isomerase [Candidatus Burarchaeum sp.]|nr:1-(5-phosphoribosyl)-5-[(5-phosphoribosylamino)methylideneamino] imidazole-4-carboxamide isomerase [Candidatus Burarchaeum sp.]MDO8339189.1 1-(5-phosphoribosyl)-5-[(5-phosphoribosylamino)methylideneamino] imidazole-4-carboxamide isomerase [Candidatus Burarchaeum sp.]
MRLIGALDLSDGMCVRLVRGRLATAKVYYANPLDALAALEKAGADSVHVIDLDAAILGERRNAGAIFAILKQASLPAQVGGGIRSLATARELLDAGAERVVVSSALAEDTGLVRTMCEELGGRRIAAAIDDDKGRTMTRGWTSNADSSAGHLARKAASLGVSEIIYTDISRDGSLEGLNEENARAFIRGSPLPVVLAGGVASTADALRAERAGAAGLIVGKAFYEGKFNFMEARRCL